MRIHVGGLSFNTENEDLKKLFESYGTVLSARIECDRETGRSRGFGFVEMENAEDAQKAIEALNGTEFLKRSIIVNPAKERERRSRGDRDRYSRYSRY